MPKEEIRRYPKVNPVNRSLWVQRVMQEVGECAEGVPDELARANGLERSGYALWARMVADWGVTPEELAIVGPILVTTMKRRLGLPEAIVHPIADTVLAELEKTQNEYDELDLKPNPDRPHERR